jgi:hypothetical protein
MSVPVEVPRPADHSSGPWSGPVVVGAIAVVGTGVLAVLDPSARDVPLCPLKAITGLDCPFCGSLRAVHALAHLDPARALDHNVVFTLSVPFLVIGWIGWLAVSRGWTRPAWWRFEPPVPLLAGVALLAFAVARNLPAFAWLGSGA